MDNGASSYGRYLEGDDSALTEIIRIYKDGLQNMALHHRKKYCNRLHPKTKPTPYRINR